MARQRTNLIGLSREELAATLAAAGATPLRAKQLWHWMYYRGVTDFAAMTTLSKRLRETLADRFVIARPEVRQALVSKDRSCKWLLRFADGNEVETVFIPEEDRGALCISTQVGCTLTCTFCHTGTQRLVRNLAAGEIVGQMMVARDACAEWPSPEGGRMLSNIVLMGMGEPLFNYDAVATALRIIMDGEGIAISKRRITLSTSGVVPMMRRCGAELGVNLAVSLHAVSDALRDELVPINRKYPIAELLAACRKARETGRDDLCFFRPGEQAHLASPDISIDYAVMERVAGVVVPLDCGWNDLGIRQSKRVADIDLGNGKVGSLIIIVDDYLNMPVLYSEAKATLPSGKEITKQIRNCILLCCFRVQKNSNKTFGSDLRGKHQRTGRGCPCCQF